MLTNLKITSDIFRLHIKIILTLLLRSERNVITSKELFDFFIEKKKEDRN